MTARTVFFVIFTSLIAAQSVCAKPADIDNDGKDDLVLFNPTTSVFTVRPSGNLNPINGQLGAVGDIPVPFKKAGVDALATFNRLTGIWTSFAAGEFAPTTDQISGGLQLGDFPITARFTGEDDCEDIALFDSRNAVWRIKGCGDGDEKDPINFGDKNSFPLAGDVDGDGADDLITYNPLNSLWKIRPSRATNLLVEVFFGLPGDVPFVFDLNGDGYDDIFVFRPYQAGIAQSLFIGRLSQKNPNSNPLTVNFLGEDLIFPWGSPGDLGQILDVGGDGKADFNLFRPAVAQFFVRTSELLDFLNLSLGGFSIRLVAPPILEHLYLRGAAPMDFNRDGRSDFPILFKFNGLLYYLLSSIDGNLFIEQFGVSGDRGIYGDVEGDLVNRYGVVRKNGDFLDWFLHLSTGQVVHLPVWGLKDDNVHLGDINCDGKDDVILSRSSGGLTYWFWRFAPSFQDFGFYTQFGAADAKTFVADTNGDRCDELVVAQLFNSTYYWYSYSPLSLEFVGPVAWGVEGDSPMPPVDFDGDMRADLTVIRTTDNLKTGYALTSQGQAIARPLPPGVPCVGNFSGLTKAEFATYDAENSLISIYKPGGELQQVRNVNAPSVGSLVGPYCEVAASNSPCTTEKSFSDGQGGALWKPHSEGVPGHPVALLPDEYYGNVVDVQILSSNDEVVGGVARKHCCPNGNRAHWWINQPTSTLAQYAPLNVRFVLRDGTSECRPVPNPFDRID